MMNICENEKDADNEKKTDNLCWEKYIIERWLGCEIASDESDGWSV